MDSEGIGEEARFGHTLASGDQTPQNGHGGNGVVGAEFFHNEVHGDLGSDEENISACNGDGELVIRKFELFLQAGDAGVSDVRAIQEREKVCRKW